MKLFKHPLFIAILILIAVNVIFFWKFYFKGLLPFPGDLLVSYYFPWSSGGFAGFDPWTTRKGVVAMDVIRQIYPWKDLAFDQIKNGQWPLWNSYNFSGTPLLANLQSSVFFPGNFVFFLLPKIWAWVSLVVGLPLVFNFFCYLFLRSLKLSNLASIFGAIAISNLASITVWSEQLIVIQSVIFLPLILFLVNRFIETKRVHHYWLIPPLLAFSIFGGHPQSVVYVYAITFFYLIFKKVSLVKIVLCFALSLGIASIQLMPSLELYKLSARENDLRRQFVLDSSLPWKNLVTILAPDFFGSPATFNFRGMNYDNSLAYFGVVAFLLSLVGLFYRLAQKEFRFFLCLAIFGLLFALPPLAYVWVWLSVPIFSSGPPSRIVLIFGLAMATMAAFGLDSIIKKGATLSKKFLTPILIVGTLFAVAIISTFFFTKTDQLVSLKNLIVPLSSFGLSAAAIIIMGFKKPRNILVFLLIATAVLEYGYFFNKYQPFSPQKFVFPKHPVFDFIESTGYDRYFGVDRAYVDSNFATYYRVFTPEGYDPLYIKSYGEFMAASNDGKMPAAAPPSDAFVGKTENSFRNKLFDILAVKYVIDKTDDPVKDFGPNDDRFPAEKYTFIKQVNKWKYYERKSVLPRVFLSGTYRIETNSKKTIETFYDESFNPKTLLLEVKPTIEPSESPIKEAKITEYTPNKAIIETSSDTPKLLFLSDNFYPGWKAYVDGIESPVLRADYTFRAVALVGGTHKVVFEYRPESFAFGAVISITTLVVLGFLIFISRKKHV